MTELLHEAQQLVRESRRIAGLPSLLARFIDSAAEALVIAGPDGNIALFNRKAVFLFGWQPEEVIGKPIEILLPEGVRKRHEGHRAGYAHDPYTRPMGANLDLMAQHRDGHSFPVTIDLQPEMADEGLFVRAAIRRKDQPPAQADVG